MAKDSADSESYSGNMSTGNVGGSSDSSGSSSGSSSGKGSSKGSSSSKSSDSDKNSFDDAEFEATQKALAEEDEKQRALGISNVEMNRGLRYSQDPAAASDIATARGFGLTSDKGKDILADFDPDPDWVDNLSNYGWGDLETSFRRGDIGDFGYDLGRFVSPVGMTTGRVLGDVGQGVLSGVMGALPGGSALTLGGKALGAAMGRQATESLSNKQMTTGDSFRTQDSYASGKPAAETGRNAFDGSMSEHDAGAATGGIADGELEAGQDFMKKKVEGGNVFDTDQATARKTQQKTQGAQGATGAQGAQGAESASISRTPIMSSEQMRRNPFASFMQNIAPYMRA